MEESNSPSSSSSSSLERKHTAMMQRLSELQQSRTSPKPIEEETSPSQTFLSDFSASKLEIHSAISLLPSSSSSSPKSDLESISLSISNLEHLLASHSYLLTPFDLRSCLLSISDLKSRLSTHLPKKKFSFKNKPRPPNPTPTLPTSQNHHLHLPRPTNSYHSPGFKDKTNQLLLKDFRNHEVGEFVLSNLEGCQIRLIGSFGALFVHKLKNCKVYVGAVAGSGFIEDLEDCVFVLAAHQIRIHHAKTSDFYLRVRSRPIIEDTSGVRFAPYCLRYDGVDQDLRKANLGEELGNWANVDDFKWLRAVQSPNWEVLPECERIGTVSISSLDGC